MLYEIIKNIDIGTITKDIAISFYLGIMTDTCKFTTPNVTYHTHEIIAEILKRHDIDISKIQNLIFNNNSPTKIHFLGYMLLKRLKIITNYNTSYMMITKEDYTKFRLRTGDTDGIVNYGLSLKDVFFTAMFNEKKDGIYISFRSIGNFPVNDFAKTYFNGGGHKNAAGGFSNMTLKETVKNFVNIIKSLKNIKDGYQ
jgi:phosphoesterase RecJ-like protein